MLSAIITTLWALVIY
jgi:hypothetical protein